MKHINVERTVANILAVPNVQFKLLNKNEKENRVLLVTPTSDNFERGLITLDPNTFSVGVQAPNADGKITLTLQPITPEFLELIVLEEETKPVTE